MEEEDQEVPYYQKVISKFMRPTWKVLPWNFPAGSPPADIIARNPMYDMLVVTTVAGYQLVGKVRETEWTAYGKAFSIPPGFTIWCAAFVETEDEARILGSYTKVVVLFKHASAVDGAEFSVKMHVLDTTSVSLDILTDDVQTWNTRMQRDSQESKKIQQYMFRKSCVHRNDVYKYFEENGGLEAYYLLDGRDPSHMNDYLNGMRHDPIDYILTFRDDVKIKKEKPVGRPKGNVDSKKRNGRTHLGALANVNFNVDLFVLCKSLFPPDKKEWTLTHELAAFVIHTKTLAMVLSEKPDMKSLKNIVQNRLRELKPNENDSRLGSDDLKRNVIQTAEKILDEPYAVKLFQPPAGMWPTDNGCTIKDWIRTNREAVMAYTADNDLCKETTSRSVYNHFQSDAIYRFNQAFPKHLHAALWEDYTLLGKNLASLNTKQVGTFEQFKEMNAFVLEEYRNNVRLVNLVKEAESVRLSMEQNRRKFAKLIEGPIKEDPDLGKLFRDTSQYLHKETLRKIDEDKCLTNGTKDCLPLSWVGSEIIKGRYKGYVTAEQMAVTKGWKANTSALRTLGQRLCSA